MSFLQPHYKGTFNLEQLRYRLPCTAERLDDAARSVHGYMQRELYMPGCNGMDGSVAKYSGLARNGSLVILEGLKPANKWQTAIVTVVNMRENDDGLVKILKKIAVQAVKR